MTAEIIVALDGIPYGEATKLARRLEGEVWGFKLNDLLLDQGVDAIRHFTTFGKVMADPKLHDIPNTIKNSVRRMTDHGADIITVHAMGGANMLLAAREATEGRAKIAAVTVLTSVDNMSVQAFYGCGRITLVRKLADLAVKAGIQTIVLGPEDLAATEGLSVNRIVPAIRPTGRVQGEDQEQSTSVIPPQADYVVVGRAITQAEDPLKVIKQLKSQS